MITATVMRRVLAMLEAKARRAAETARDEYNRSGGTSEANRALARADRNLGAFYALQDDPALLRDLANALNAETRGE